MDAGVCRFETTISIDCPPTTLYERWCDQGSWPTFAEPLTSTLRRDRLTPASDLPVANHSFDALAVNRIPGELLAWRTIDGAVVPYAAEAWIHGAGEDERTELQVFVSWFRLDADSADARVASGRQDPETLIADALNCFKRQMECQ
jgi:uncharacterized membrane protein